MPGLASPILPSSEHLAAHMKLRCLARPGLRYDPWMDAASRGITVSIVDLPEGVFGRTDGLRTVWLDRCLLDWEARCTLAHELIHIERGHTSRQSADVEAEVEAEAACRLIAPADFAHACSLHSELEAIAAQLLVRPETLAAYRGEFVADR